MSSLSAPSVLVVEDNPSLRNFISTVLLASGYQVNEAADGMEALKAASDVTPNLVLLDLGMPVFDGFSVLELLRVQPAMANVPVMILTGRDSDQDRERALSMGAVDFMTKPFSAVVLAERVDQILAA